MSLINSSLEYVYCSNLVSNHVLIRLIRFVSRFTVHFYNTIYFSTTFSIPYKRFIKNLHFVFWDLNKSKCHMSRCVAAVAVSRDNVTCISTHPL